MKDMFGFSGWGTKFPANGSQGGIEPLDPNCSTYPHCITSCLDDTCKESNCKSGSCVDESCTQACAAGAK
jgi:hypothetical protein